MEDSQPTQIACSGDKAIGVAGQPFGEEVRWVIHEPNQPSQQKPGIERGLSIGRIHGRALYPVVCIPLISTEDQYDSRQKHCQLGLNLTETGQNKERLSDFWDSTGILHTDNGMPSGWVHY